MDEFWQTVAAERRALADDLATLGEAQWATEPWCAGWTVRDVLAHLTATASLNPGSFFAGFLSAGFNFERFATKQIGRHRGDSSADTLARFRAVEASTSAPPGPKTSWLGEVLVHVEGPMGSLVMAMTGRSGACDDLVGLGVATLRARGGGAAG